MVLFRTIQADIGGGGNSEPFGANSSPIRTKKKERPSSVAPGGLQAATFTPVRGPKAKGYMDTPS